MLLSFYCNQYSIYMLETRDYKSCSKQIFCPSPRSGTETRTTIWETLMWVKLLINYFAASIYTTLKKRKDGHIKPDTKMFPHKTSYQVMMLSNTNTITRTGCQLSNGKHKVSEIIVAKDELKQIKILFTESFTPMKGSRKCTKPGQQVSEYLQMFIEGLVGKYG